MQVESLSINDLPWSFCPGHKGSKGIGASGLAQKPVLHPTRLHNSFYILSKNLDKAAWEVLTALIVSTSDEKRDLRS